ncbi:hypothetical protein WMF38_27975 [Sorangium sp. So ce118]
MTPMQLLARIAALIPPPRFPWQRLSGVFAPRSPLRAAVVASEPVARAFATTTRAKTKARTKARTKTKRLRGSRPRRAGRPSAKASRRVEGARASATAS